MVHRKSLVSPHPYSHDHTIMGKTVEMNAFDVLPSYLDGFAVEELRKREVCGVSFDSAKQTKEHEYDPAECNHPQNPKKYCPSLFTIVPNRGDDENDSDCAKKRKHETRQHPWRRWIRNIHKVSSTLSGATVPISDSHTAAMPTVLTPKGLVNPTYSSPQCQSAKRLRLNVLKPEYGLSLDRQITHLLK